MAVRTLPTISPMNMNNWANRYNQITADYDLEYISFYMYIRPYSIELKI